MIPYFPIEFPLRRKQVPTPTRFLGIIHSRFAFANMHAAGITFDSRAGAAVVLPVPKMRFGSLVSAATSHCMKACGSTVTDS